MNLDPRRSTFGKPRKGQGPIDSMRKWIEPALKVTDQPLDPDLERRLRRPMMTGAILIGVSFWWSVRHQQAEATG